MGFGLFRGISAKIALIKSAIQKTRTKEPAKALTNEEVAELRKKGKRIVYHYRSNEAGTILSDWYGRMYSIDTKGVIQRLVKKVNGKIAKRIRQTEKGYHNRGLLYQKVAF